MILPIGLRIIKRISCCCRISNVEVSLKLLILLLTFISYTSYHLSRRPLSVVKNVLHQNCTKLTPPPNVTDLENWCNWAPFNTKDANTWLGTLDSIYLFSYAIFMYFAGFIAERCNLRYFIAVGMLGSGIFTFLFGLAYNLNIHSFYYFAAIQIISGAFQSTGWPAAFACVSNWFGSTSSRGVIFGIWNSHAFVGNILGLIIAGAFSEFDWGLSFSVPAFIIMALAVGMFLFLVPYPEDVGLISLNESNTRRKRTDSERDLKRNAISFWNALLIPGVIEFSICLFFSKLVSYTFLYWLPLYIRDSTLSSPSDSAFLSISFDIGGIVGAILVGYIDDLTGASALTCIIMFILTIPSLYFFQILGPTSNFWNIGLQFITGGLVNGPYCLITTVVCTELGDKVDSNALATVTAIIDGTGSIGAAIGPFLAGLVSTTNWNAVFYMVMIADLLALCSISRIVIHEYARLRNKRKRRNSNENQSENA